MPAVTACGTAPRSVARTPASPSPSAPGAPTASSTPSPALSPAFVVPSGFTAGIAVFDRQAGTFTVQHNATMPFRSASLVKLLIALDFLWDRGPGYAVPAADRARLDLMLRSSDDSAATYYWSRRGQGQIVVRMSARLALRETAPPPAARPKAWGYTALSAADIVRVYRYVLDAAPAPVRDYVLGNLRQSTRCGTDRYDQSFGIPTAFDPPWAVKQGWSGFGDSPATPCAGNVQAGYEVVVGILDGRVLHTTGTVGQDDRSIVAVLTQHPSGTSFAKATAALTRLVGALPVPGAVPRRT
jgi:hypothetical protein